VLRHAEVNVFVPARQRSSGMAALIVGDIDHARERALANLRMLANAVRDGYTVVCSEPTAALMLRQEYVKLTEDLDAELVAANTMEWDSTCWVSKRGASFRASRAASGPRRLSPALPLEGDRCGHAGLDLMRKVLSLDVEFINQGCSGMGALSGSLASGSGRRCARAAG